MLDLKPSKNQAPVDFNESTRLIVAKVEARILKIEGGEVENSYLHGSLEINIYTEQSNKLIQVTKNIWYDWKILNYMWGMEQAGHIWGSFIILNLKT